MSGARRARPVIAVGLLLLAAAGVQRADPAAPVVDRGLARLVDTAEELRLARKYDQALITVRAAQVEAERTGDLPAAAAVLGLEAMILEGADQTEAARQSFERALAAFERVADGRGIARSHAGLSRTAAVLGDRAGARAHGDEALRRYRDLGDERAVALVLQALLGVAESAASAHGMLEELLAIAARLDDAALRGVALKARGSREFAAGDLAAAHESFEAAIAAFELTDDREALAACHLSLGRVLRAHGDHAGALARYQRAIELLEPAGSRLDLVEAINASAVALGYLKRQPESIAAYERGLALARETGNPRYVDFMLGNLAGGYMEAREWARALPLLQDVLSRGPDPYIAAFRHNSLAIALTELDRPAEAVEHANDAVRLTRELQAVESLHGRLSTRAWVLDRLGRLDDALADMREALLVVERMRATLVPSDFLKRGYGDTVADYYDRTIDLLSRLGRADEGLALAEEGRARAFLDLLAARETAEPGAAEASRGPAAGATGDIANRASADPLSAAGIAAIAARLGSTIVAYWVSDAATTIWVVRPDGRASATRVHVARDRIAQLVADTTAALRDPSEPTGSGEAGPARLSVRGVSLVRLAGDPLTAWRELDEVLVAPIRSQLPEPGERLAIVPHDALLQLSFAALRSPAGRYLIEDYELHYAPAVSVLEFTGRRQTTVPAGALGPWLLVGDPAAPPVVDGAPLPPLPGAAREMTAIASAGAGARIVRLTGPAADESSLARIIATEHPTIVHFATHGLVPDDTTSPPFLALQQRSPAEHEDGRLTSTEVYGLALQSDLVVLSACRSGLGRVGADGMQGLTRAFFAAGAPSVVATFWDVTDETTPALMDDFYRTYGAGIAKGAALRAAQLGLLADLRAGRLTVTSSGRNVTLPEHPVLWAAFFLTGEP